MGVAGAGKTTVGQALAESLGWAFHDADAFHPAANVEKMRRGVPLDDADRAPWLAALHDLIAGLVASGTPAVLACSALREAYRESLLPSGAGRRAVELVQLDVAPSSSGSARGADTTCPPRSSRASSPHSRSRARGCAWMRRCR
jgi:gluconokinase